MNKCYLSKNYNTPNLAGNKAKMDIESIMHTHGFRNIGLSQTTHDNSILGFARTLGSVLKSPFCMRKGDILVLQYPLKKYYSTVCKLANLRGCKVVTLIHDLGSFRRKKLTVDREIKRLSQCDYLIVHNTSMKKWLEEQGYKKPIGCLEIFDYLSPTEANNTQIPQTPYQIVYAGGLSPRKNNFLYELGDYMENYQLNLYGNGFIPEIAKGKENFIYKGFVPSDQLISEASEHFGLVWDGDTIEKCSGAWGEYLKYNNPHKTSLYIRCQLPVIIWKQAALASFIEENNIGITIESLIDLNDKLSRLSPEEYREMVTNIKTIDKRLNTGYYFLKAFRGAEAVL